MKAFGTLAVMAFAVLMTAAIWLGALNQDEGWYLYAAGLVGDGRMPYRDFFYTQGPLMPIVYSAFTGVWKCWGLLGARILTAGFGLAAILVAVAWARRLAGEGRRAFAGLATFFLLGCNLYHLYYTAIPKTYALAGLFVVVGFYLLSFVSHPPEGWGRARAAACALGAGVAFAFAAGTRISLGAIMPVVGCWLLFSHRRWPLAGFCVGGFSALALVYGPFLVDPAAREGLMAAQAYHASRGGFDPVFTVGSLSRLVRWYLPVFILFGLAFRAAVRSLAFWAFGAVVAVQMLAPFPYEDYQVPVMALLAVVSAVGYARREGGASMLPVLGLAFACAFGSPLLECWMTNGQDRFWTLKKERPELAQLRDVARRINELDPGGKTLLTQDTYLAIETGRRVPEGLEMGPFAMLSPERWNELLGSAPCPVAALSGYSFAIDPPKCTEVPMDRQIECWTILKRNYDLAFEEQHFGQNATTLLVLERKK